MRKHTWFWVVLFIIAMTLVALLAASWNVVLVRSPRFEHTPWFTLVLGSLGFIGILTATLLLFIKLLREMKLNQLQNEFLAKVSHELKSPITSMELTGSLLKQYCPQTPDVQRLWDLHNSELRRLRTEVDVLLETFRWETKPFRPEFKVTDLEQWLTASLDRWRLVLGKDADVLREGPELPRAVRTDPRFLDLISNNIIDNARKYKRERPTLKISTEVAVGSQGNLWRVHFQDAGWGFDPESKRRIFKRFYRAKSGAPYAIGGTGLGLYLAFTASRKLGLKLRGHSEGYGKGATFTIEGRN